MAENGYLGRQPNDSSTIIARQQYIPTGITSVFEFAAGYDTGYLDVYLNGVRLAEGRDFNAGDGNNVYIVEPFATEGDILEVVAYKAFNPEQSINYGANFAPGSIGIQSAGTPIGVANTLNFVGTGNTFAVNGNIIDVSISGGGGALGERLEDDPDNVKYKIYKQKKVLLVDETISIDNSDVDTDYDGVAYVAEADIQVAVGNTMTIGAGVTFRTNILGIFP